MTTVEEAREARFIRPDGKEKVTGAGRYTADLSLTGQAHAKFRYADHTHARILRIDTSKARALPGVLAVVTHEGVPDVLYGGMVKDRRLFAKEAVRFEGDIVAGVAATTAEIGCRREGAGRGAGEPQGEPGATGNGRPQGRKGTGAAEAARRKWRSRPRKPARVETEGAPAEEGPPQGGDRRGRRLERRKVHRRWGGPVKA